MGNQSQQSDGGKSLLPYHYILVGRGANDRNGTGGIEQSGQKAIDLGATALKAGILHIDTAQYYGTEAETWGAIEKAGLKREDVWVTDKSKSSSFRDGTMLTISLR
jgi:diketogulonate reductase-like aldo/keto reductase